MVCTQNKFQKKDTNATLLQYNTWQRAACWCWRQCPGSWWDGAVARPVNLWHCDRLCGSAVTDSPWGCAASRSCCQHPAHTHQGRLQQALLGPPFKRQILTSQQPVAMKAPRVLLPWSPLHTISYIRSSSSQSFIFIIIFIVSDVSTFSSFRLVSCAFI